MDTINELEVLKLINKVSGKEIQSISRDQSLIVDLDLASIEIIDLIFEIEKKYKIGIKLEDFLKEDSAGRAFKRDLKISHIIKVVEDKMKK